MNLRNEGISSVDTVFILETKELILDSSFQRIFIDTTILAVT